MSKTSRWFYDTEELMRENRDSDIAADIAFDEIMAEMQQEQPLDKDYQLITIDYSNKSWEQFDKDLKDPSSELVKALAAIGEDPC